MHFLHSLAPCCNQRSVDEKERQRPILPHKMGLHLAADPSLLSNTFKDSCRSVRLYTSFTVMKMVDLRAFSGMPKSVDIACHMNDRL